MYTVYFLWRYYFDGVFVSVFGIVGMLGNVLTLCVLSRKKFKVGSEFFWGRGLSWYYLTQDCFHKLLLTLACFDSLFILCGGINYSCRSELLSVNKSLKLISFLEPSRLEARSLLSCFPHLSILSGEIVRNFNHNHRILVTSVSLAASSWPSPSLSRGSSVSATLWSSPRIPGRPGTTSCPSSWSPSSSTSPDFSMPSLAGMKGVLPTNPRSWECQWTTSNITGQVELASQVSNSNSLHEYNNLCPFLESFTLELTSTSPSPLSCPSSAFSSSTLA